MNENEEVQKSDEERAKEIYTKRATEYTAKYHTIIKEEIEQSIQLQNITIEGLMVMKDTLNFSKKAEPYIALYSLMKALDEKEKELKLMTDRFNELDIKRKGSQAYKVQSGEVKIRLKNGITKDAIEKMQEKGMTIKDIAKACECSIMTVRRRLGLTTNGVS